MRLAFGCVALAAAAVALSGCASFVPVVDMKKVDPAERQASLSVRIFDQSKSPPKVEKMIGDVDAWSCKFNITDKPASIGNALAQLRLKAYRMGANAVINVVYEEAGTDPFGTNCYNTIHAQGVAVIAGAIPRNGTC